MKPVLIGLILATVAMCYLQGCISTPSSGVLTADENGLVFKPAPISPTMAVTGLIAGFAMSHCSTNPTFRGCSDIYCQVDVRHQYCTEAAIKRLKKKGVL